MDLLIDGKPLSLLCPGVIVTTKPPIPAAERDVKTTDVPGRIHGTLTQKLGWKDVSWSPSLALYSMTRLPGVFRQLRGILNNATKLAFDDDANYYYRIKSVNVGAMTPDDVEVTGSVSPTFVLDPLERQVTFPSSYTDNFSITNPGTIDSEPLITLTGSGVVKVTTNTNIFTIDDVTDEVTIDTENSVVMMGGADITSTTSGDFPTLVPGINHVLLDGVTKLTIDGRWCYV